jgi:restriction system protein
VFEILMEHPDGLRAKEVLARLEKSVPPTEFEQATYPKNPDQRRFEKIVRFSTINTVKAGWLVKDKGQWSLTDEGRDAFRKYPSPEQFAQEAGRLYRKWQREQPDELPEEQDEEIVEATTIEEAEEGAWAAIEEHLACMNPYDFQELVAGLLKAMGYNVAWVSPPGPDQGVDILAHADPLGITGPRIKVQVKRRADRIAVDGIRAFLAMLGSTDVGLFVNTGGFTKDAQIEARGQEIRRVMLVDLRRLFDLWVEHYDRIAEQYRRLLPLRPVYYLAPDE